MTKIKVDNSAEIFGDKISIADLAQNSFKGWNSDERHIYHADSILQRDWRDELVSVDMEYLLGVRAAFKDGSVLSVSAWAGCCDHGDCKWCGGRY